MNANRTRVGQGKTSTHGGCECILIKMIALRMRVRLFMQRIMRGFTPYPELLFCQLHKKVTKKSLHD